MPTYGTRSKSEIVISILNALEKEAGITSVYPGSIARAFAEAIGSEMSDLYESFKYTVSQMDINTANGRNLDLIGALYGVSRKQVSPEVVEERSSYNIQFRINTPYSSDIVIPKGTLIFNDVSNFSTKQYSYITSSDTVIYAGSKNAYGRIQPNFSDNAHVAAKGTLTKHNFIAPATVNVFCSNTRDIFSNNTGESDSSYRRRILASMKSRANGTSESIRFAALSVKGVKDVRIREASYGIGSCDIIVVPESPTFVRGIGDRVLAAVAPIKPVGIRFNIRTARDIPLSVTATVTFRSGISSDVAKSIQLQAKLFTQRYLNSFTVGDSFSVSELENIIKSSSDSIKSVVFNSISTNGRDLPIQDYSLDTSLGYIIPGNITINSVIMGSNSY